MISREQKESIKRLAESDEVKLLMKVMKDQFMIRWAASDPDDLTIREHLFRMCVALDGLSAEFQGIAVEDAINAYNDRSKYK